MNLRILPGLAIALSCGLAGRPAQAQEPSLPNRSSELPAPSGDQSHQTTGSFELKEGYSLQILAADAAALTAGLFLVGNRAEDAALLPYATFSPMVHFAHGNPGRGVLSFVMHAGLPYLGAYSVYALGHSSCTGDEGICEGMNYFLGGVLGITAATLLDTLVLAKGPRKRRPVDHWRYALAPTASITPNGGATVGIMGLL